MPSSRNPRGFTLIEILITIALMSVILTFSSFAIIDQRSKARDAIRKSDIERVRTALYEYHFNTGCFPSELPECGTAFTENNEVYLANMVCDPSKNTSYAYETDEGDCKQWFKLMTNVERPKDPSIAQSGCSYGCGESCNYNYGVSSTNIVIEKDCINYFVCAPGGACEQFADPFISKCPRTFINDPTCENVDCNNKDYRCQNASGKSIPD